MGVSNRISPDGKWAAGDFPWPYFGMANLSTKTWEQYGTGCSPAIACDGSNRVYHFQQKHRHITFFESNGDSIGVVDVHTAPEMKGWEVTGPRWLTAPRFIVTTGPYSNNEAGWCVSDDCGDLVNNGGTNVEIFFAKFNATYTEIEAWLKVTNNDMGDFFPYVWIDLNDTTTSSTVKPIRVVLDAFVFQDKEMMFDVMGRRVLQSHTRAVQGYGQRRRITKRNWSGKKCIVVR